MSVLSTTIGRLFALAAASACVIRAVDATCVAASGDQNVGLQQIQDSLCLTGNSSYGNLGCIANSACRFCKYGANTIQSQSYIDCLTLLPSFQPPAGYTAPPTTPSPAPTLTPTCTINATAADRSFGINLVTDTSCSGNGLGCLNNVCRYCKDTDTPKSTFLYNCTNVLNPTAVAEPLPSNCTAQVSPGDLAAGVTAVRDETCAVAGGIGCFKSVCRYCKTSNSDLSANFLPCSNFQYTPATYPSTASVTFYWFVFSGQSWTFDLTQSQRCYTSCVPDPWSVVWTGLPTTADPSVNNGRSRIVFYQTSDCSGTGNAINIGDYAFPTINNMTNIGTIGSFLIQETSLAATSSESLTCAALQYW